MLAVFADLYAQTSLSVAALRPRSYRRIATDLGLSPSAAGMLSDLVRGRYDHISAEHLCDLRRRLDLPVPPLPVPARPCPTCGIVHGDGLDCHGQPGDVTIIPPGARIIPPSPRKRPPYKRPTWAMVRALQAEIDRLQTELDQRPSGQAGTWQE